MSKARAFVEIVCIRDKIPPSFSQLCVAFPVIRSNSALPFYLHYRTEVGLTVNEVRT